jgi:hypothetical protein
MTDKPHILHQITTGEQLAFARALLNMSQANFGIALGIQRNQRIFIKHRVYQLEQMETIPRHYGVIAECLLQGARPSSWPGTD